MKFPFFASFIVFCIWLGYEIHKHKNMEARQEQEFWDREAAANSTRRKPLDDLDYIQIPFDSLPMGILADDPVMAEYHETLRILAESPIVNFTGISNTDLKLMYGAPNIDLLSRYDQSYTTLVRTLQSWGDRLYESGYVDEACRVLEFAVETRTDSHRRRAEHQPFRKYCIHAERLYRQLVCPFPVPPYFLIQFMPCRKFI